jgi:hypothetical protein
MTRKFTKYTRDETEHGQEYYLASEVDKALAAQPAVPDAIHHTDLGETLEYIQGWNDCRAETLKMRKP